MKKASIFVVMLITASFLFAQTAKKTTNSATVQKSQTVTKSSSSYQAKASPIKGFSEGTMVAGGLINLQLQGGNQTITTGAASITADAGSESIIDINPYVGYFISDILMVGLGVGYYNNKQVNPQTVAGTSTFRQENFWSFKPNIRMYKSIVGGLNAYLQGEVEFGFGDERNVSIINSVRSDNNIWTPSYVSFGIAPGVNYFLTKRFALDFTMGYLGYEVRSAKQVNTGTTTSASVGTLRLRYNNPSLGVCYFF